MDLPAVLVGLAAFASGSIPFGLLVGRWAGGIDVRTVGSGNVGATNVGRALGRQWFAVVFLLDAAKGVAPLLLLPGAVAGRPDDPALEALAAFCAVLGHVFSPWLGFKGGKGVATTAGVLLTLAPWAGAGALAVFLVVLAIFRYVSLASILAAVAFVPLTLVLCPTVETRAFAVAVAALVILRHRTNIARLRRGVEPRAFTRATVEERAAMEETHGS